MSFSVETVVRIWDDLDGSRVELCDDSDGLDLAEIRHYDGKEMSARITMLPEQAVLLARAILKKYDNLKLPLAE